jgi:hypothetical protein
MDAKITIISCMHNDFPSFILFPFPFLSACADFTVCCANLEGRLRLGNEVRRPKMKIEGAEVKYSNKFDISLALHYLCTLKHKNSRIQKLK